MHMNVNNSTGSSPLARGLPQLRLAEDAGDGIIPARAGFTVFVLSRVAFRGIIPARAGFTVFVRFAFSFLWDHPRSRGVYGHPRVLRRRRPGIIPARAGFTRTGRSPPRTATDHPRSRGVYCLFSARAMSRSGSSPLARGLQTLKASFRGRGGIIPARAGFTPRPVRRRAARQDHPRSRGVYTPSRPGIFTDTGSSPLARGLHDGVEAVLGVERIIPARAGFTTSRGSSGRGRWDHPRSRGVYLIRISLGRQLGGSSPLARGLPRKTDRRMSSPRIIPARAGFTAGRGAVRVGEDGSSPLARGLPHTLTVKTYASRIIPARAGFTIRPS